MRRVLRFINLSIAALLLLLVFFTYWFAWRPLPKTNGEIHLPIQSKATVERDAIGVPHIHAASIDDALFLQGYVTAQDRLWQMDVLRRVAAGDLSEVIGARTIDVDKKTRMLRMRRAAEEHLRTLAPADRAILAAYARGVNSFLETHVGRYPLEFTALQYDPRPWSAVDSILAGMQMFRNLTTTYEDEIEKQSLLAGGDPTKVNFLFSITSGREEQPGSNAWAISGAHTATGKPILANDPHLEFSVPATWYQVHLQAPGLNVTGVSLPGVPCVIVGHNDHIAWGVTNLGYSVQDLYVEQIDTATGKYLFRGQQEQARLERDNIPVKGQAPVEFQQWVTRHGAVFPNGNQNLALRWTATEPGAFQFPFLQLNRAANWQEFTAALARFPGPGQNFVYADTDGNIGYHATGLLPIRPNYQGDLPVDGSSGEDEWDGYIPFESLPTFYNPPNGIIVTANQDPFPRDYQYPVQGGFAPEYREHQIRSLLSARNGLRPADMLTIQKDVYSALMYFLAQRVAQAVESEKPATDQDRNAAAMLRKWNGQMEKDTAPPMLVALIYSRVRDKLAEIASPGKGALYTFMMAPSLVETVLASGAKGWVQDEDKTLLDALHGAFEDGRNLQGRDFHRWNYGKFMELTIQQPIFGSFYGIGKLFNVGPVEMSGSTTTVKQTSRRLGPSMRFIADTSNWDNSLNNITVGESGEIFSSHYKDQWPAYWSGHSFPMQFGKVDAKSTLTVIP